MKTIREHRERLGITQSALAMRAGMLSQNIYLYEAGKKVPSAVRLRKIAEALGVSMDEILITDNGNGRRNGDGR